MASRSSRCTTTCPMSLLGCLTCTFGAPETPPPSHRDCAPALAQTTRLRKATRSKLWRGDRDARHRVKWYLLVIPSSWPLNSSRWRMSRLAVGHRLRRVAAFTSAARRGRFVDERADRSPLILRGSSLVYTLRRRDALTTAPRGLNHAIYADLLTIDDQRSGHVRSRAIGCQNVRFAWGPDETCVNLITPTTKERGCKSSSWVASVLMSDARGAVPTGPRLGSSRCQR
jgi:hypothetical protein